MIILSSLVGTSRCNKMIPWFRIWWIWLNLGSLWDSSQVFTLAHGRVYIFGWSWEPVFHSRYIGRIGVFCRLTSKWVASNNWLSGRFGSHRIPFFSYIIFLWSELSLLLNDLYSTFFLLDTDAAMTARRSRGKYAKRDSKVLFYHPHQRTARCSTYEYSSLILYV